MRILIREVPLTTIWQVRKEVMYPELDLHAMKLPDDEMGQHLGLFDEGDLCSVISLFRREQELQFRKFATLTALQGKGYGSQLLRYVFEQAAAEGMRRIWCNARTTATGLYKQFEMSAYGATWEQQGHLFIKMQKEL